MARLGLIMSVVILQESFSALTFSGRSLSPYKKNVIIQTEKSQDECYLVTATLEFLNTSIVYKDKLTCNFLMETWEGLQDRGITKISSRKMDISEFGSYGSLSVKWNNQPDEDLLISSPFVYSAKKILKGQSNISPSPDYAKLLNDISSANDIKKNKSC